MNNKEKAQKTYEILQRRKKLREYQRRSMENDLNDLNIRSIEKASRRKMGQI